MERSIGTLGRYVSVLAIGAASTFASVNAQAYCSSNGGSTTYEWIERIDLPGFYNISGANGGYADYTSQTINLTAGDHSVTLTPGFGSSSYFENWKIWIDLNRDGEFTTEEEVFSGASSNTINGLLSVPDTASSGPSRMRVSMAYGSAPGPCSVFTYGEVEDYSVNLDITDTTWPTVQTTSPNDAAVEVGVNTAIEVQFSEDMDPQTFSANSIALVHDGIYATGTVSVTGNIATFTPDQPLELSTDYTATVYAGVEDLAGNPLLRDYVWNFTTVAPDVTAPTVTWTSPDNGAVDVDNNLILQAQFSEPMEASSINSSTFTVSDGVNSVPGTVVLNGDGYYAQFYPDQPYAYSTLHTVTISGNVMDLAGNAMGADYSWVFTSREQQPDYCSAYSSYYNYIWISSVKVGSYTHHSSQPYAGYYDFTDTVFDLSRYFSNGVTLTPGFSYSSYNVYWRVFVDWNHDGVFGADEYAFTGGGSSSVSGQITVPETAPGGLTRMRVIVKTSSYPEPCGSFSYGLVQDFRVDVPAP